MATHDLERLVRELDRQVSSSGWDQPTRLFAVAKTTSLTTIEQDLVPQHRELDELLRSIEWPSTVAGAAISTERVTGRDGGGRHEIRITMVVLQDGSRRTALRWRDHDTDDAVVVGEELVSHLGDLLHDTLTAAG